MTTGYPPTPARRTPKTTGRVMLTVAGILVLIRVLVPRIPVYSDTSTGARINLSQAHDLCTSALGSLAQAFSASASRDCTAVGAAYDFLGLVLLAALAAVVIAIVCYAQAGR
jgi:hypothetical protein